MYEELLKIVKTELGQNTLSEIRTRSSVNRDGENVFWVDVVYLGSSETLSVEKMQRVTDRVWAMLEDGDATPVLSFISSEDLTLEAAE